ncbi:hypothetical protein EDD86DRAFT_214159 [Gorgonomyces haynaldii]|nr:hypothetical protein EDD86DRAFT_214159 [Gorgonomyces haynaldii]
MGEYFVRVWGKQEFVKTFAIVSGLCQLTTLIFTFLTAIVTLDYQRLFLPQSGMGGFIFGLTVSFKQTVPEHQVRLMGYNIVRVKHIPSIVLLLHLVLYIFGFITWTFFMHLSGLFWMWIYTRYYKYYGDRRGDRSETFSFISFFPDQFAQHLKPISTTVYTLLVKYKLLPPLPPREQLERAEEGIPPQPISDSDRRKQLALRALEERLQSKK